ncbi:MAG: hypothetical protein IKH04_03855 [Kiritimatiellae bacterium]|nr:hypothetical protein [Kiritimatiellia bacterium]
METLRPGEVTPRGWLRDWCETARDGYVSRMDEVDIAFQRCRFSSLRPAIFRGDAERHPENVVFRDCSRVHLDRLAVRHHPGYGGGRPDTFMEIEGVADVRIEPGGR